MKVREFEILPNPPANTNVAWLNPADGKLRFYTNGEWKALTDENTQLQADWNQSDNTKADYIKNKPIVPIDSSPIELTIKLYFEPKTNPDPEERPFYLDRWEFIETSGRTPKIGDTVVVKFDVQGINEPGMISIMGNDPMDISYYEGLYVFTMQDGELALMFDEFHNVQVAGFPIFSSTTFGIKVLSLKADIKLMGHMNRMQK